MAQLSGVAGKEGKGKDSGATMYSFHSGDHKLGRNHKVNAVQYDQEKIPDGQSAVEQIVKGGAGLSLPGDLQAESQQAHAVGGLQVGVGLDDQLGPFQLYDLCSFRIYFSIPTHALTQPVPKCQQSLGRQRAKEEMLSRKGWVHCDGVLSGGGGAVALQGGKAGEREEDLPRRRAKCEKKTQVSSGCRAWLKTPREDSSPGKVS